jgi:hypothetical protein
MTERSSEPGLRSVWNPEVKITSLPGQQSLQEECTMTESELVERLERLEDANRRLKTVSAVVLIVGLAAIYSVSCVRRQRSDGGQTIYDKIVAHEIEVVGRSGGAGVKIFMLCPSATTCLPVLQLFDEHGKLGSALGTGSLSLVDEKGRASLDASSLQFSSSTKKVLGQETVRLGTSVDGGGSLSLQGSGLSWVYLDSDSPTIELGDPKGFTTTLGSTQLAAPRTGETRRTSAASIVMSERSDIIWEAP